MSTEVPTPLIVSSVEMETSDGIREKAREEFDSFACRIYSALQERFV